MEAQTELTGYARIAEITGQMLEASQHSDWDLLQQLEAECAAHIALISKQNENHPLTTEDLEANVYFIQKILRDDREIRKLLEPWMEKLALMMSGSQTQAKLNKIYGIQ